MTVKIIDCRCTLSIITSQVYLRLSEILLKLVLTTLIKIIVLRNHPQRYEKLDSY